MDSEFGQMECYREEMNTGTKKYICIHYSKGHQEPDSARSVNESWIKTKENNVIGHKNYLFPFNFAVGPRFIGTPIYREDFV